MTQQEIKLPDMSKIIISSSPHIQLGINTQMVMLAVIIALMPAFIASLIFFGLPALYTTLFCIISCLLLEIGWNKLSKRSISIKDLSAVLTGLLLGMNMPSGTSWFICLIASFFAIIVGKCIFGGLGQNPFNPALVGRVAVFLGFSGAMSTWAPTSFMKANNIINATTHATPLGKLAVNGWESGKILELSSEHSLSYLDLFLGNVGGSLGETSALALLIGGIFLIALHIIRWEIPFCFIATVFICTQGLNFIDPVKYAPGLFHILCGGVFLGAFFMATDLVTSPMTHRGNIVFAIGCGLITVIIRVFCSFPEGVSFAILFMNALVPLIDSYIPQPKVFGHNKPKKA